MPDCQHHYTTHHSTIIICIFKSSSILCPFEYHIPAWVGYTSHFYKHRRWYLHVFLNLYLRTVTSYRKCNTSNSPREKNATALLTLCTTTHIPHPQESFKFVSQCTLLVTSYHIPTLCKEYLGVFTSTYKQSEDWLKRRHGFHVNWVSSEDICKLESTKILRFMRTNTLPNRNASRNKAEISLQHSSNHSMVREACFSNTQLYPILNRNIY